MEAVRGTNAEESAAQAANFLTNTLVHYSDIPTLLLVSGGSSLSILNYMNVEVLRNNLQIAQIDERWTPNERDRNSSAFKKTAFYTQALNTGVPFVSINVADSDSPEESAKKHEWFLKQWHSLFRDGVIIAMLGIGSDGHIAGVLPNQSAPDRFNKMFYYTRDWVAGYRIPQGGAFPARVTTTLHFLYQEVTTAIVYACGDEKREALQRLYMPEGSLPQIPARILHQMRDARLFSDMV